MRTSSSKSSLEEDPGRVWMFHLHVEGRLPASGSLTRFRSASDFCGQGETADVTMRLVFKLLFMSLSKWIGDGSCYETCVGV